MKDRRTPGLERLDRRLRAEHSETWGRIRGWITSGKVFVDGCRELDPGAMVGPERQVSIREHAPRPKGEGRPRLAEEAMVHVDRHVVVVEKPAGISSVPYDPGETGTLDALVGDWLRSHERGRADTRLHVVHRIDKETTGLLMFARTLGAKRHLQQQFRLHTVERRYLAIAAGTVSATSFDSRLVRDRGDGRRGSTRDPTLGRHAVTHVEPLEALVGATLLSCRLETGRTHQIRIHLSEAGHPLAGDRVYGRQGDRLVVPAPRLMLHAADLGFVHPGRDTRLRFSSPMPADMTRVLESLRDDTG